jgi:hypothetical protein
VGVHNQMNAATRQDEIVYQHMGLVDALTA